MFLNQATAPQAMVRSAEDQARVDQACRSLTLYHMEACPFCIKVTRHMKRLALTIGLKDIKRDTKAFDELMAGGKQDQVPCLRIEDQSGEVRWLYESSDINNYLTSRFSQSK